MTVLDTIVIGLGAMGAAALDHLARRGQRVLGLERFGPAHDRGSSHGRSRAIRLAYFEDPCYVPLLRRAYENWRDLERRTGTALLTVTGTLEIGAPDSEVVAGSLASCRQHALAHDLLDAAALRSRWPVFELPGHYVGLLQPEGGYLLPEEAIRASLAAATRAGAIVRFDERVLGLEPRPGHVVVETGQGTYAAGQVVVAAGAWAGGLVPGLAPFLRPTRQVLGWFRPRDLAPFALGRLPVFIVDDGPEGDHYGFPAFEDASVKIARHGHLDEVIDPEAPCAAPSAADVAVLRRFLARRMPALDGEPVRLATCTYTGLPGGFFLIDRAPADERILVASPCSGHGFKFASVVGEILADLVAQGRTAQPIAPFSWHAMAARACLETLTDP
ncbi:N-methyl-L-tryptophan oxidase [Prosthecomicrobium sp. N25]|uniref:N-methyl-L-tryptophan oxidase n=1 Tax=Prosthecomicrobium sp. N25 TaxID=3129254 RepID=UPI0030782E55